MDEVRHRNGPPWAWLLVGLIGLVVVIETVVLAVMASLLSLFLAVAVPLVVLVVAVLVVRGVQRKWAHADDESWSDEHLDDDGTTAGRHADAVGSSWQELST